MRERPGQVRMTERPLKNAGWMARSLAQMDIIDNDPKKGVRVYIDPERPYVELIKAQMWTPDWRRPNAGEWVEVEIEHRLPHAGYDGRQRESLCLHASLPRRFAKNKELCQFLDEATDGWRKWVDKEVLPKAKQADWRVAPGQRIADHGDDLLIDEGTSHFADGDDPDGIYLIFEGDWEVKNLPQGDKVAYLQAICQAVSGSYQTAVSYLDGFAQRELPKLIQERERRVKQKPPGWMLNTLKRIKGTTDIAHNWAYPDSGVEPDTHIVTAIVPIEKEEYGVMASYQDHGVSGYMNISVVFPVGVQAAIDYALHNRPTSQSLGEYLRRERAERLSEVYGKKQVHGGIEMRSVSIVVGDDTLYGYNIEVFGIQIRELSDKGISPEKVLLQYLENVKTLHPHLMKFAEKLLPE